MHPAFSIIFFTTASGAGYGMLAWLGLLGYFELLALTPAAAIAAFGMALGLVSAGLLSSTFHLGHPERAWRAFSQWRSSWLSREGVAAVIAYVPALACAAGWFFGWRGGLDWAVVDLFLAVMALVTVFTTSMIYASLKAIPAWHDRRVPPAYLILALATGGVLLTAVLAAFDAPPDALIAGTVVALAAGFLTKRAYWSHLDAGVVHATAGSATGLDRIGNVRQLEAPNTAGTWVLKEMGHNVARRHATKLRMIATLLAFLLPAVALIATAFLTGLPALLLALIAAAAAAVGIVVERWLFFAEAKHVVTLYYGSQHV